MIAGADTPVLSPAQQRSASDGIKPETDNASGGGAGDERCQKDQCNVHGSATRSHTAQCSDTDDHRDKVERDGHNVTKYGQKRAAWNHVRRAKHECQGKRAKTADDQQARHVRRPVIFRSLQGSCDGEAAFRANAVALQRAQVVPAFRAVQILIHDWRRRVRHAGSLWCRSSLRGRINDSFQQRALILQFPARGPAAVEVHRGDALRDDLLAGVDIFLDLRSHLG